jgi:hypothetical protein
MNRHAFHQHQNQCSPPHPQDLAARRSHFWSEHIVAILRNSDRFSDGFIVAVTTTLANIDSLSDGLSGKVAVG